MPSVARSWTSDSDTTPPQWLQPEGPEWVNSRGSKMSSSTRVPDRERVRSRKWLNREPAGPPPTTATRDPSRSRNSWPGDRGLRTLGSLVGEFHVAGSARLAASKTPLGGISSEDTIPARLLAAPPASDESFISCPPQTLRHGVMPEQQHPAQLLFQAPPFLFLLSPTDAKHKGRCRQF